MATSTHINGPFYFASVPEAVANLTVSNLQARRGLEGPQIILTWTKPVKYDQLNRLRIVRKMGSYPDDETDGKIALDTTNVQLEYYTDFPGYGPEYFYYKVFCRRGSSWISTYLNEVVELAHDTQSELQDKFFRELGEPFTTFDKERFGSQQRVLESADLDIYEKILLAEDGETDQGEFRRFLKLPNLIFNEILALTRAIATRDGLGVVHDVKRTKPQYLDYIAKLYGWRFNFDLPVGAARQEIIDLPDVYRKKGREDITTQFINNILAGHTVTIVIFDDVLDWNDYPDGSFLDTTDLVSEVNFLTSLSDIYVIVDNLGTSTIGFNQIGINVVPDTTKKIKASEIRKLENIMEDFFSVLDDVFIIVHQTFTLNYPTDFTTAGVNWINFELTVGGKTYIQLWDYFGLGQGDAEWDYGLTPTPLASDTLLTDEQYRAVPRNVVYADASWVPTSTPGKKVLVRCFVDKDVITSLYNREVGLFGGGSLAVDTGTLLAEKFFPLRFVNDSVRYIVDFRIQFP